MFKVTFTGDRTTDESAEFGDFAETGWLDPDWSMTTLHPNKEDVRSYEFDTLEEAIEFIETTIGAVEHGDAPFNYYGADAHMDTFTGDTWTYCGHVEETD